MCSFFFFLPCFKKIRFAITYCLKACYTLEQRKTIEPQQTGATVKKKKAHTPHSFDARMVLLSSRVPTPFLDAMTLPCCHSCASTEWLHSHGACGFSAEKAAAAVRLFCRFAEECPADIPPIPYKSIRNWTRGRAKTERCRTAGWICFPGARKAGENPIHAVRGATPQE